MADPICEYTFYKDGNQMGESIKKHSLCPSIEDGGCVVLGQVQAVKQCGSFDKDAGFEGFMTEVRLWNSVRTVDQIHKSWNTDLSRLRIDAAAAASETDLVALWPLDCVYPFDDIKGGENLGSCSPADPLSGNAAYTVAEIVAMDCPCNDQRTTTALDTTTTTPIPVTV